MTGNTESADRAAELQQRALAIVRNSSSPTKGSVEALSSEENRQMLHELRVHQIELEMQNEDSRATNTGA